MEPLDYRKMVIKAINTLTTAQISVFTSIVNVGSAGDYKELDFEEGEEVEFELAHFDTSDDANVQTLMKLFKQMEDTKQRLINLNAVDDDELETVLPEG